ncbi:GNAT family N-acetyltransferase [Hyphococcus luteus]|nr:GNAT family N-acetyltransferase [Marinicaulis flavus]
MTLIHTRRFLLRPIEEIDAPVFARLCNDEQIARNTSRIPHPYTLEDAEGFTAAISQAFALGKEFAFAVCDNGELIACCGVTRITIELYELGYWVSAPARGCGVATEAARAVSHFAFAERSAEKLLAGHFTDNPASGRVLEKTGFRKTGETRKQFSLGRGGEAESARMAMMREDFAPPPDVTFA